ncbi:uncharacterized protein LOC135812873 [Sycon ciliatum]|uniref:uncharacterized protein LOC135812873 n=1 Tax=Sycon ciliatum TaxID=27933 RepID=UPI0031F668AA
MAEEAPRRSARRNFGQRPSRFLSDQESVRSRRKAKTPAQSASEYDHSSLESCRRAAIERREQEMELEAAERIAELKRQELALEIELANKRLAVERARAAEQRESLTGATSTEYEEPHVEFAVSASGNAEIHAQSADGEQSSSDEFSGGVDAQDYGTSQPGPFVCGSSAMDNVVKELSSQTVTQGTCNQPTPTATSAQAQPRNDRPVPAPRVRKSAKQTADKSALSHAAAEFVPLAPAPQQANVLPGGGTNWPDAFYQLCLGRSLKPLDLPKFDGQRPSYLKWKQRFLHLVHENPLMSEDYKLAHLREALAGGSAADLIADVLDGPGAYTAIMEELDRWFGGKDRNLEQQERELMAWPRITNERDLATMKQFAVKLRNTLLNMKVANITPGRELYLSITQKVPRAVLAAYFDKYDDTRCDAETFSEFVMKRVHKMTRVEERLAPQEPTSSSKPTGQSVRPPVPPRRHMPSMQHTLAAAIEPCGLCGDPHHLAKCPDFQRLTVDKRWDFVRGHKGVCSCCLSRGHWSNECRTNCSICKRRHHQLLHSDRSKREFSRADQARWSPADANGGRRETAHTTMTIDTTLAADRKSGEQQETTSAPLSFMTAPVLVKYRDRCVRGTALLDPASSTSYVRQHIASAVGADGPREPLTASVLSGEVVSGVFEHVTISVEAVDGSAASEFRAWAMPSVCPSVKPVDWSTTKHAWEDLKDIPFPALCSGQIDVLIGLNAIQLHTVLEEITTQHPSHVIARHTPLGWVCLSPGRAESSPASFSAVVTPTSEEMSLEVLVRNHLEMESAGTRPPSYDSMPSADDRQVEERTTATAQFASGRVELGVPWIEMEPHVSSNRPQAAQRLRSLEHSLSRRPSVRQRYHDVMQSHLAKGYIREVPSEEVDGDGDNQWFLPHFPVVRDDKETTKVRIVFDAAAKWDGRSINDEMHSGPALQTDLVKVLIRFCSEPVALVADISEMFLQVMLRKSDRKYHRFLWRFDDGPAHVYEFQRVVFGIKASPYLAGRAVQEVLRRFGPEYPAHTIEALERSRYIDDLLASRPTVADAVKSRLHCQEILAHGGFHLRKWLSNSAEVVESVPVADRAASTVVNVGDHVHCTLPTTKTLGVTWSAKQDTFTFRFQQPQLSKLTRRSVLSGVATAFDPRGQISPFIIRARVLLQDTWLLGLSWDDELPSTVATKWKAWFGELPALAAIAAPRSFKASAASSVSIHTFTDASDRAIAAATYVRAEDSSGAVRVTLAMAKAKTAPTRRQTIPQLELRGAVLGLRISSEVGDALDVPISEHTFWTDSMNVLGWIRSHSRRFKVDIGNRVSELQRATKPSQWRHVPGKQNPADKGTRGLAAEALASDQEWWHGPKFLAKSADTWPQQPQPVQTVDLPGEVQRESTFMAEKGFTSPAVVERLQPEQYSRWQQLARITAWCQRFICNCRRRVATKGEGHPHGENGEINEVIALLQVTTATSVLAVPELAASELQAAEDHWVLQAQIDVYGSTRHQLAAGKPVQKQDPLAALGPELDSSRKQLLVVGGRLKASSHLPYRLRQPVILPAKHTVTRLIVEQQDRICKHAAGPQHLLAKLRERFWIVNGLSVTKAVRQACVRCRRQWRPPASQIMGQLPDIRTAGSLQVFTSCGIDFAGPFQTKQGRGRAQAKRYLCLFTCLETRACHLELVYSLDTDGFLLALTRFTKRRGTPQQIVTDNGTNFSAAARELREAVEQLDRREIARSLADNRVRWRFNPPRAPHFGGAFEVMIKAAKRALYSTLAKADITDEELHTAFVIAEELINSRPLMPLSADPEDPEALTPQHFLAGRCSPPLPIELAADARDRVHPRERYVLVQQLLKEVWTRWLTEFVPLLNARKKWRRTQKNVEVGDVVLCMEPDTPRGKWPMGRVCNTFPGPDGCVRVVDVCMRGKTYRRSIHRLIPILDMADN